MSKIPRILPLLAVAIGGVIAVRALDGAVGLPDALAGAKAWAEDVAPQLKGKASKANTVVTPDSEGQSKDHAAAPLPAALPTAQACGESAAALAKQAGMSPAEMQVLQSLGERRGQLDQREKDMDVQLALLAAAEAKVDAKIKAMNGLKDDIQGLIGQADAEKQAEVDRLVRVYEAMKPKDAAARMTILDDAVRLPIAAKMKERSLSAILAQMAPADAKSLTEKLADRMAAADRAKDALANPQPAPAAQAAASAAAPAPAPASKRKAARKTAARRPAKRASAQAAALPSKPQAYVPAPAAAASAGAGKTG